MKNAELKIASLGSGSAGNATLISSGSTVLLLDCGFALKEIVARCNALSVQLPRIDGVLITHEHSDHVRGLGPVVRKYDLPVWITHGSYRSLKDSKIGAVNLINAHEPFQIGDIAIDPFPTPHDAAESCQFIFQTANASFACVTDLGVPTAHIVAKIADCDALLIESNYDDKMLRHGPYPPSLQSRIRSDFGHLGNEQAGDLLCKVDHQRLETILLGHLSEKNNTPEMALNTVAGYIQRPERLTVLEQHAVSQWFSVARVSEPGVESGLHDGNDVSEVNHASLTTTA